MDGPGFELPGSGVGLANGNDPTGFRKFMAGLPLIGAEGFIMRGCPPAPNPVRSGSMPKAPIFLPKFEPCGFIDPGADIEGIEGRAISLAELPKDPGPAGRYPPPPNGINDGCE